MTGGTRRAIGIFDSGVGGLSVLQEIVRQLPHESILYLADSVHVPYGDRALEEIREFSRTITSFLIEQGAAVVVVACNTASAAALHLLRAECDLPIVGMEPAIKPAVQRSQSRHVGVIATQTTFQGELFAQLVERFAQDVTVHMGVCPGLVERVESGLVDSPETEAILRECLTPMLEAGIDSLVLGCTHYPFLRPAIERVLASARSDAVVIDPAPAVARQTGRVLASLGGQGDGVRREVRLFTSGDPALFGEKAALLAGIQGPVQRVYWDSGRLST
ncbi:glutamate racemase [Chloroflexota bacterium]